MVKIRHVPKQLLDVTITPVLFLLMFTYLFGGAVAGSTSQYLHYLLPGILVQTVLFTWSTPALASIPDMTKGVVDRCHPADLAPGAALGAMLGASVRYALAATVVVLLGLVMGFRPGAGALGVLAGILLVASSPLGCRGCSRPSAC